MELFIAFISVVFSIALKFVLKAVFLQSSEAVSEQPADESTFDEILDFL